MVYEDEPSSLIAYTLASQGYLQYLRARTSEADMEELLVSMGMGMGMGM